MDDIKFQKPFLKWIGGKTQIIDVIVDRIPKEINNYHELFLGGGSVLLAVLSMRKENKIKIKGDVSAYDNNSNLINVYKHIQNNKDEIYKFLKLYFTKYDNMNKKKVNTLMNTVENAGKLKENYYYWLRDKYNTMDKNTVECSAIFIFLNKTCFRGMYREGPNGFNVSYGHYKKTPKIISKKDMNKISNLIKDVNFIHSDFRESIKNVNDGDFVYLDPLYAPENSTSFVGYIAEGFDYESHKALFKEIKKLDKIKFIMSNSNVKMVRDIFINYECQEVIARRSINSKNPGSTTVEVIINN